MQVGFSTLRAAGLAMAIALAPPLPAQDAGPPPPADEAETLDYLLDDTQRMTVPVSIAGRGPYDFIVDTGSERTVISHELARELGLGAGRIATVHSMTEVSRIPTVIVPGLQVGARRMDDIHAPALARRNLGAAGMLGVDSLQSQRVDFDFAREVMTITPSRQREERWDGDTIVITGRSLFGRLVLVDASVDGQRVHVIIDTGAQMTVGNGALRRALARRNQLGPIMPVSLLSVTGTRFTAEASVARRIKIGGVDIVDLPIAFADAHPFRQLRLENRPAILLGMDALRLFDRVSVDFANRRVRVMMPGTSRLDPPIRMASAAP
ncbi:MAG: aspartyl protease family protein [Sphingomonas sp.]|nr:aspartyl protease family protein [Sphingomonas sp.]